MNLLDRNQLLKNILIITAIVFLVIASLVLLKNPFGQNDTLSMITVTGKGEIQAVPDISRFTISSTEKAGTQSEALAKSSEKVNAVVAGLKNLGISEKDIKTENGSTYPDYEYVRATGEQKIAGWVSSHTLSVKVRTLDLVPSVRQLFADQAITNVSGPDLSIDDTNMLQLQARELAIQDAKDQAKILANQLGVRLGKIVSFGDTGSNEYSPMYARENMITNTKLDSSSVPEVVTGEQTITSNVSVTYRIK